MKFLLLTQLLNVVDLVQSAGQIVSDYRIANKDITPSIGRGYSVASGNMASLCLDVDMETDITEPSFDYSYFFNFVDEDSISDLVSENSYSNPQALLNIQNAVAVKAKRERTLRVKSKFVVATMEVEKYYISADETKINMMEDAKNLLDRSLYVQFFQVCGPSFIRSISRTCEFAATFNFKSTGDVDEVRSYVQEAAGNNITKSSKANTTVTDLTINMMAYGIDIGLSNSFMARDFDDYGTVVDAAFQSMMDPDIGVVKSIEVVPWVNNIQFQAIIKLDTSLETSQTEGGSAPISPFMRRFNLITNSEHVARLAEILRHRMRTYAMVMKCLSAVNAFPPSDNSRELMNKHAICPPTGDCTYPPEGRSHTVFSLKEALMGHRPVNTDNTNTGEPAYLIERLADNINDYLTYYMTPCLTDMTREVYGVVGGLMQTTHWIRMNGCSEVSCVFAGTKWNGQKCEVVAAADNMDYVVDMFCPPNLRPFNGTIAGE